MAKQLFNFHPPTLLFIHQNAAPKAGWHSLASQFLVWSEVALAVPQSKGAAATAFLYSTLWALGMQLIT
jgi:hypothetical protein